MPRPNESEFLGMSRNLHFRDTISRLEWVKTTVLDIVNIKGNEFYIEIQWETKR